MFGFRTRFRLNASLKDWLPASLRGLPLFFMKKKQKRARVPSCNGDNLACLKHANVKTTNCSHCTRPPITHTNCVALDCEFVGVGPRGSVNALGVYIIFCFIIDRMFCVLFMYAIALYSNTTCNVLTICCNCVLANFDHRKMHYDKCGGTPDACTCNYECSI